MKIKSAVIYLSISSLIISLWIGFYDLAHYLLSEQYFIYHRLPIFISLIIPGILLISSSAIMNSFKSKVVLIKSKMLLGVSLVIAVMSVIGHKQYQTFYSKLQRYPKIKKVTKNWTIQGDKVAIYGKNFGQAWQSGTVKLNDFEYQLVSWDDKRIVIEQPAINEPQVGKLTITNHYGNQATLEPFEIKDPSEVLR